MCCTWKMCGRVVVMLLGGPSVQLMTRTQLLAVDKGMNQTMEK